MQVVPDLDPGQAAAALELIERVAAADGSYPVSEPVRLHLRHAGDATSSPSDASGSNPDDAVDAGRAAATGRHDFLSYTGDELVGYAHLADGNAELAATGADPTEALLAALEEAGAERLWAHGERSATGRIAADRGWQRDRVLWQLRRPLTDLPTADLPPGVTIRPFRPGRDEAAWLALNNRAFASHPDQGGWTERDIALREQEPWFDPAGFLLAERDGALVGFHWTKIEDGLGEVYVLGVDPDAGRSGLGKALTAAGLRHLQQRGVRTVLLYVDDTNAAAMQLYERAGFTRWDVDVQYSRRGPAGPD